MHAYTNHRHVLARKPLLILPHHWRSHGKNLRITSYIIIIDEYFGCLTNADYHANVTWVANRNSGIDFTDAAYNKNNSSQHTILTTAVFDLPSTNTVLLYCSAVSVNWESLRTTSGCLSIDSAEYHRRDAVRGDTILMSCNETQSSEVKWIRNTSYDGYSYVYINGTIRGSYNVLVQFSVVNASTLRLYNVQPTDSGLYDCYDTDGTRIVGYHVVAVGTLLWSPSV